MHSRKIISTISSRCVLTLIFFISIMMLSPNTLQISGRMYYTTWPNSFHILSTARADWPFINSFISTDVIIWPLTRARGERSGGAEGTGAERARVRHPTNHWFLTMPIFGHIQTFFKQRSWRLSLKCKPTRGRSKFTILTRGTIFFLQIRVFKVLRL